MSILSHQYRFLFIHVAKTGGRSVNLSLARRCPQSERFNTRKLNPEVDVLGRRIGLEIRDLTAPEQWNSYFKFAFVRNPWDRTVSMYRHIRSSYEMNARGKMRYLDEITRRLGIQPDAFTFDIFVRGVLRDRVFDNYHWDKQIHCFTDRHNQNVLDFIGRFEDLQQDFDTICRQIGFPLTTLPHHNRTRDQPYETYYTPETVRIVEDLYREDVDMFRYEFGRNKSSPVAGRCEAPSILQRLRSHVAFHSRRSLVRLRDGLRPAGSRIRKEGHGR